ncbi:MAG TPA: ATP-binding protein [Sphingomicrobium sp.]|nr:ATP-binding protein [Sphingomicrobium sp.]
MPEDHQLAALGARRIDTDTDPDDLVLPEKSGGQLGRIANWLAQPPSIFREWGLNRYVDGGFRVLFRGPSGTGKTMAAVALARSTEKDLFHVDCSSIVSKYVGETEKNLHLVFKAADEAGAILLFDEADALFGKRSGVKDSHDRYANAEIGRLLRRIEPFEGLAILTTNSEASIDPDVLTRIDAVVEFPRPDQSAREAIWSKLLHAVKLPQGEVDAGALAKHELTGAEILRCVRVASLVATTEERKLDMELLNAAAAERIAMRDGLKG